MLAIIHTMFVNEKIIRIHSFCPFSPWNTKKVGVDLQLARKDKKKHIIKKYLKKTRKITTLYLNAYNNKRHL